MIDISADAKMLLSENRKTLFKADLILNGNIPSAEGENLDIHENGRRINITGSSWGSEDFYYYGYFGVAQGFSIENIPRALMSKYKYMIISYYMNLTEMSNDSEFAVGYVCLHGTQNAYRPDTANKKAISIGRERHIGVFLTKDVISDSYDKSATIFMATFLSADVTKTGYLEDIMCELNDTGIPSEYADSYVYNGGSYSDFLTAPELSLTGDDVMANTTTFSDSASSSGSFDIGAAIINSLSLTLNNYDGRFDSVDFTGAALRAYIGIPLVETEWITKGYYTVDKPTSIGNTIPLTMLDNMSKFEKPYSAVTQIYPATLASILQTICVYCGVVLDSTTFPNSDFTVNLRPDDENITCLSMVSYIAQIAGCYARVNRFGYLQLKWYDADAFSENTDEYDGGDFSYTNSGNKLDGGDFTYTNGGEVVDGGTFSYGNYFVCHAISSFSIGTDEISITGIKVVVDSDNEVAVGGDGYVLEISDNPLITADNMSEIANYLGNKIVGLTFRPFNISALSEPSVEAGDAVKIIDQKGNTYKSFITTCGYKYGNYEPFACNAQSVSEKNATSYSPITNAVAKARKDTEKALTEYDKAVVSMNEIILNAMGYHSSYTENLDGSRISYIHNKPLREESTIIWMFSASGFFLSTDGGATYNSGWDANGNAVFNILYAIGIVCDWIKGGTLTLGGSGNVNGLMRVLNASGTEVVRADYTGLKAIGADITGKITASSGSIGGFGIGTSYIGNATLGQALDGMKLETNGDFAFSRTRGGTWSKFNGLLTEGRVQLWTGGSGGGIDVSGDAPGGGAAGWIRWGFSDGNRSDGYQVAWYSGSDKRLKKNIKTLDSKNIRKLFSIINPVEFNYNEMTNADHDIIHFGGIAQEIESALFEIGYDNTNVVEEKEIMKSKSSIDKPVLEKFKFINYQELHGFELAGIKDLYEITKSQQETIDKQQAEIDELKAQMKLILERLGDA